MKQDFARMDPPLVAAASGRTPPREGLSLRICRPNVVFERQKAQQVKDEGIIYQGSEPTYLSAKQGQAVLGNFRGTFSYLLSHLDEDYMSYYKFIHHFT